MSTETNVQEQTEAVLAERFALAHADELRYDHRRATWLRFEPPIWRPDRDGAIVRMALDFIRDAQADSLEIDDRKAKERAFQFALKYETTAKIHQLLSLARNLIPLADAGKGWDADPWLIATTNGVLDLRSGTLRPGRADDRLTMGLAVPYSESAEAPRFEQFVEEIFDGDADLIRFVQRFIGYSLTGVTSEQVLALLYGKGANGKSTLLEVLGAIFGDYAYNLPFSAIELRQRASIPNELAALDGRRFVTASETNDGTRLNEARIKALTGCDRISARFLHGEWFSFSPVAKFFLAVNHKPVVHDDSTGFWRRIRLIPFRRCFTGSARNENLKTELLQESSGILRWAVEGCLAWQQHGLEAPASVLEATSDYQDEADPLSDFLAECCEGEPTARTRASALFEAYTAWADKHRVPKAERLSMTNFGGRLSDRFVKRKTKDGKFYEGVRIVTDRLW